jgi:hypothetical protein
VLERIQTLLLPECRCNSRSFQIWDSIDPTRENLHFARSMSKCSFRSNSILHLSNKKYVFGFWFWFWHFNSKSNVQFKYPISVSQSTVVTANKFQIIYNPLGNYQIQHHSALKFVCSNHSKSREVLRRCRRWKRRDRRCCRP